MKPRKTSIKRETKETSVSVTINLDGTGKTTILNLISGFLEPNNGKITVDGKKIIDNVENWQKLISYVPQKIFFTDDTIKNNICLGLEENEINHKNLIHYLVYFPFKL